MKLISLCTFSYICFAILFTCFGDNSFDIKSVLENIPEADKADFLKYHLSIGYNLSKSANCDVRDMRTKLSLQIYNYMVENHKITDEGILRLLREIICFDDGTCVDIGDVGIHPFY